MQKTINQENSVTSELGKRVCGGLGKYITQDHEGNM